MENTKKIVLYVAQGIGLLAVFVFSYFGLNYMFKGNLPYSIPLAFIIVIALVFFVSVMLTMKSKKQNTGFTGTEGLFLILYALAAAASFFVMTHFINVDYLLRDEITATGNDKLKEIDEMLTTYTEKVDEASDNISGEIQNAIDFYKGDGDLKKLNNSLSKYDIDIGSVRKKAEVITRANQEKTNKIEADEQRALKDVQKIKKENTIFINEKKRAIALWDRARIHFAFDEIDTRLERNLSTLQSAFKASEENTVWNEYTFDFPLSPKTENLLSEPIKVIDKYKPNWILPFIVFLFIHLLILLPYLASERDGYILDTSKDTGTGINL